MTDPQARAMTDQPAAVPTPGPWHISKAGHNTVWADGVLVADCDSLDPRHPPADQIEANCQFIAASWATAAERDPLVKALDEAVQRFATIQRAAENGRATDEIAHMTCLSLQRVRAALTEARKP